VEHRRDDTELLAARRIPSDVDPDRADGRDVPHADAGCDRAGAVDDAAERRETADVARSNDAAIDEDCPEEVPEIRAEREREADLDAALEQGCSAERLWQEIRGLERWSIGIAELDVRQRRRACAAADARRVRHERRVVDREYAWTELIFAESAHRVRAAGVEALAWMQH